MKKIISLIMCCLLTVIFSACSLFGESDVSSESTSMTDSLHDSTDKTEVSATSSESDDSKTVSEPDNSSDLSNTSQDTSASKDNISTPDDNTSTEKVFLADLGDITVYILNDEIFDKDEDVIYRHDDGEKIIPRFGFIYNEDIGRWSNERFPLLFEYFPRFTQLDNERKKCLGGYIERLDFRIFAKKVKLTIDDILHPLPDAEREYCFEMHNHALSKGLKVQIKDPYCIRYIYKRLYSLEISNNPFRITVSYRLDNGKRVEDQFDRFFDVMNAQPDKDELIEYLKGGIRVCDACGGKKKPNERCGKWVELNGSRRLISMCLSSVSKYRRGLHITDYNEDDIRILKRMLDIRIIQIDKYLSDCEYR